MTNETQAPWSREEFEAKLREKGKGYHIYHPIHVLMYEGKLTQTQMQAWVANRYYYQIAIPMKDAAILSNCPDRELRRGWIQRIFDPVSYTHLDVYKRQGLCSKTGCFYRGYTLDIFLSRTEWYTL